MDSLKGWRTIIVNGLVAVIGVAVAIWPETAELAPSAEDIGAAVDEVTGAVMAILGAANVFIRFFTSTPVFKKDPE